MCEGGVGGRGGRYAQPAEGLGKGIERRRHRAFEFAVGFRPIRSQIPNLYSIFGCEVGPTRSECDSESTTASHDSSMPTEAGRSEAAAAEGGGESAPCDITDPDEQIRLAAALNGCHLGSGSGDAAGAGEADGAPTSCGGDPAAAGAPEPDSEPTIASGEEPEAERPDAKMLRELREARAAKALSEASQERSKKSVFSSDREEEGPPSVSKLVAPASDWEEVLTADGNRVQDLVGLVVRLDGLKSRAELNGRRARAVRYDPEAGRLAVQIKGVGRIAVLPSNVSADEPVPTPETGEWSWTGLLRRLSLSEYKHILWHAYEEKLFNTIAADKLSEALGVLEGAGVARAMDRAKLCDALSARVNTDGGSFAFTCIAKMMSRRMHDEDERKKQEFEKSRPPKTIGAPRPDHGMQLSSGRVCEQNRGELDADGVATPPPPPGTVHPTIEETGQLAGQMRRRGCSCVCVFDDTTSKARVFDGMLERFGLTVLSSAADCFAEAADYWQERIYCSAVRRCGVGALQQIPRPEVTALVFVCVWLCPWEAYLSRYPECPVVIVIGDKHHPLQKKPRAMHTDALEGRRQAEGWRAVYSTPLQVRKSTPLTAVMYARGD